MNSWGCKDSYLEKSIPVSEDNADDGGNNDDNIMVKILLFSLVSAPDAVALVDVVSGT
jgi:hypothetical protein